MRQDEDRNEFLKELALVAVPAFIAIIPSILDFVRGGKHDRPEHEKKDVSADSFRAYVLRRRSRR